MLVPWPGIELKTPALKAAAAAAKSLQSCPTLCDPIDGSPPGSPVPGILQARTLAMGCHCLLQCMKVKSESEVTQSRRVLITGPLGKSLDHYLDGQNLDLKLKLHTLRRWHLWMALGMRIFCLQGNVNSLRLMVNHGWLKTTTNYSKGFTLRTVVLLDPGGSCDCSDQYYTLEMMLTGQTLILPVSRALSLGALSCHVRGLEAAVL